MRRLLILFTFLFCFSGICRGKNPTNIVNRQEKRTCKEFCKRYIAGNDLVFSFIMNNESADIILAGAEVKSIKNKTKDYIDYEKIWNCNDGLVVRLKARQYRLFPAVEWTVFIKNNGSKKSQVISELYGINYVLNKNAANTVVHTNRGDDCSARSYQPYDVQLRYGEAKEFYPTVNDQGYPSGKSTDRDGWPYWNIQNGTSGTILALGWPGTWSCTMSNADDRFAIKAGQKVFNSFLEPGEEVRTPLVCMLFWKDKDFALSQNLWRRFYLSYIIPHFDGVPEKPVLEIQVTLNEKGRVRAQKLLAAGINPRVCWNDANWYPSDNGNWLETGNWIMRKEDYPDGGRPFVDWAHSEDMESLLWFEPERVYRGNNDLYKNHKDWLLTLGQQNSDILDEGNAECRSWLIDHVDSIIKANDLDWYREDMNGVGPFDAWVNADKKKGEDRMGITENMYIQGHLAYLDSLKARNPGLHFDNCASGGRRNDLESMKRAVPLLRSDFQRPSNGEDMVRGNQGHTWGLSFWFPFQGTAAYIYDKYSYRSFYLPGYGMGNDIESMKVSYKECEEIAPLMLYGDYWALTEYSIDKDKWIAWQFNREDTGDGCIQAFRREDCTESYVLLKLKGLKKKGLYEVFDYDKGNDFVISGDEMMKRGLTVWVDDKPSSVLMRYKRIK